MAKKRDKTARRKSGKKGIGPKEEEDVTVGEVTDAEEPSTTEETKTKQGELIEIPPPPPVKGGKMSSFFIGFRARRNKNRDRLLVLRFSMELQDEHDGRLPKEILDEWKHYKRGSVKKTSPEGMGTQNIELSNLELDEDPLKFTAAFTSAELSKKQVKGQGSTRKVIRLEMTFTTSDLEDIRLFCHQNADENVWLKMKDSQTEFFPEGEEGSEE